MILSISIEIERIHITIKILCLAYGKVIFI